ncbi:hypothetical protein ACROYT_G035438 [Oculina patagonica]
MMRPMETVTVITPDRFIVDLKIFSGAHNPEWLITRDNPKYLEIKEKLRGATTYKTENAPSKLGYTGFQVQEVKNGNKQPKVLIVGPETKSLQLLLLQTIPDHWISKTVYNSVKKEIQSGKVKAVDEDASKRFAPWYKPTKWNDPKHLEENNCYNYANDKITDTFAQPGKAAGVPLPDVLTIENLKLSTQADGLTLLEAQKHMCAPAGPRHLVALFLYNGTDKSLPFDQDYHFYRLDNNGHWSHKPGENPATDRDGNGDRIVDPRTAVQAPIPYEFVCFMTTNKKTVNIR